VQSRFKKNQYVIRYAGELCEIPGIEVLSSSSGQATLRFDAGLSTNAAIGQLIQHVNLLEFNELIPSFNDIFIQVVNETNAK
jgi:hypothetical protein